MKAAKQHLAQIKGRYRGLLEAAPDAMVVVNAGGEIVLLNVQAEKQFGYRRDELLGQPVKNIIPEGFAERLVADGLRSAADALAQQIGTGIELTARRKDGSEFPIEIMLSPLESAEGILVTAAIRDISVRNAAERHLAQMEGRYRGLLEAAPDAMVVVNAGGEIVLLNVQAEKQFGYRRDELLGQPVKNIIPEGFAERLVADGLRSAADALAQQIGTGIELTARRKDGSEFPIEIMLSPLESPEGVLVTAAIRDISVRKSAEKHLAQMEGRLRQAQKMEAVGQLAGGVAHDFNNLLTAILGYTELAASRMSEDPGGLDELEEVRKAGERAVGLTRQLLAFSRRQVLEPMVLDLNVIVGELEKMLRRLIGEDIDLVTALYPSLGRVRADAGEIEQVIMNLVVNSRDAMLEGGKITIETDNVELDEDYAREHVSVRPGPYVMLAVSDTGIGMDAETESHIFEPFFTTKAKDRGTGLGLSTVYGIVKQSGGWIWVYSEPSRGTTVKIYLPEVDEAADMIPRRVEAPPTGGTETVLLVEDEAPVRKLARKVLENLGYTVLDAPRGEDALSIAQSHAGPIHLVLTDVVMPEMGGADLARRVKELRPEARILYMSGYTDDAVVRHKVLERGTHFLQKPFTPASLARKVREALS